MKSIGLSPLTKPDFDKKLKDTCPILFLFYANWCGHCTAFKPEWAKVKSALATKKGIHVVEVESGHFDLLPEHLKNIAAFPTIQVVKDGKFQQEFSGNRRHEDVVAYALKFVEAAPKRKRVQTPSAPPLAQPKTRKPLKGKKKRVM